MCAIFGWIKHGEDLSNREIDASRIALKTMRHRGPDASGEFIEKNVYLGHNRLSIIDLSSEANQPFYDDEKRFVIVYNGEVYNYIELKEELEKKGIVFNTSSDTEVILKTFMSLRDNAVLHFDGMFALAIYDRKDKKTYIARDFLGQKPLYYFSYDGGLIFCSELRSLLCIEQFKWVLDKNNLYKYLVNSCYMGDTTPIKGVKKLLPGHCIEIQEGRVKVEKYWDSIPGEDTLDISPQETLKEFERLFDESCQKTMRSDVPYGVFLSGGVDSSMILNSCKKSNPDIKAYTVAMEDKDFDETDKSQVIVNHLNIKESDSYTLDKEKIHDCMHSYMSFIDEPHGDPGLVNAYFLAKSCRQEITVGIAGDGADELFGGYIPFKISSLSKVLNPLNEKTVSFFKRMSERLVPCDDRYMGLQFKLLSFLNGFPSHEAIRLPLWLGAMSPEEMKQLCKTDNELFFSRNGVKESLFTDIKERMDSVKERSSKNLFLYFYQKYFLPEYVCLHTDRAAMQSSLEVRSPFLSRSLIEFANKLPQEMKIQGGELKRILKMYMKKEEFPKEIYHQKKRGFTFPISRWLKSTLRENLCKALSSENRIFELLNYDCVQRLMAEHFSNKRNNYRILFNLFVFSNWMEKYPQVSVN